MTVPENQQAGEASARDERIADLARQLLIARAGRRMCFPRFVARQCWKAAEELIRLHEQAGR